MITQDPRSRRPVQIVGVVGPDDDLNGLFVLASDNTLWQYRKYKDLFFWQQIESIPEPEPKEVQS